MMGNIDQDIDTTVEERLHVQIWSTHDNQWSGVGYDWPGGGRLAYWMEHADPKYFDRTRGRVVRQTTITTTIKEVVRGEGAR